MDTVLLIFVSLVTLLAAQAVYELQVRLERWDYERHAQD